MNQISETASLKYANVNGYKTFILSFIKRLLPFWEPEVPPRLPNG